MWKLPDRPSKESIDLSVFALDHFSESDRLPEGGVSSSSGHCFRLEPNGCFFSWRVLVLDVLIERVLPLGIRLRAPSFGNPQIAQSILIEHGRAKTILKDGLRFFERIVWCPMNVLMKDPWLWVHGTPDCPPSLQP